MADSPSQLLDSVIDFSGVTPRRPHSEEEEEEEDEWKEEEQKKKKKRRLTGEQVHSLEKSFEVDSKLEPDRKIKLALELNLKPRQVAIWFQNRRARSKTKQLHSDYAALKSHCDHLANHNNQLQNQVSFLKDKLSNMEGKSAGTAEETISDVLDSGSTSADFQMAANAFGFGLPTLDFDPSFDPSYCSWLY